jgi:hypothetical protein
MTPRIQPSTETVVRSARLSGGEKYRSSEKARVSGHRDLALDVEVEDEFGRACSDLGEASPSAIAHPTLPVSLVTVPDEVYVEMVAVGRPVGLESSRKAGQSGVRPCLSK